MRSPQRRRRMSSLRSISRGTNNLRLVVKGGGHSYQGTSNAADSLLVWTRHMNAITLHDAFVGAGCAGKAQPQPAVSIEPGAIWGHVYNQVTTKAGRYVQGGGCMTVGVVGLILGGGFGSFSKAFGQAGASLLEAEVVTADGEVKIANSCTNPDLFWALKGGGGGFGIVTRVTLRTHELPEFMGGVFATIKASSDEAYRRLIAKDPRVLRASAFQSALGRAAGLRPGRDLIDFDGAPGPRPATGRRDVAPLLRLGLGVPAGFHCCFGAKDHQRAGAPFLGPRRSQESSRPRPRRTTARTRLPTISSGRATSKKRAGSGMPTNPPGCPSRCFKTISASASSTRCLPRRSIGACRCISTRDSPAQPRTRSRRPRTRR